MARVSGIFESIDRKLKQAVTAHGLNIDKAAARVLGDAICATWHYGMGPAPIILKGGSLFPQTLRETDDVDILAIRRHSNLEIQNGFKTIARLLEARGITLEFLSPEAQEIDTGYGDPVSRYKFRGKVGGVRANSQIDMSLARSPMLCRRSLSTPTCLPSSKASIRSASRPCHSRPSRLRNGWRFSISRRRITGSNIWPISSCSPTSPTSISLK